MKRITGMAVVLNTSFNGAGKPIVETIQDALQSYLDLELDALVMDKWLICNTNIETRMKRKISIKIGSEKGCDVEMYNISEMFRSRGLADKCIPRDRFLLQSEFFSWMLQGRKSTTIRYRSRGIEYPVACELPIFVTEDFSRVPRGGKEGVGLVEGLEVKKFGELNDDDAVRDGFDSKAELLQILREIYGNISDEELVVIYSIRLLS